MNLLDFIAAIMPKEDYAIVIRDPSKDNKGVAVGIFHVNAAEMLAIQDEIPIYLRHYDFAIFTKTENPEGYAYILNIMDDLKPNILHINDKYFISGEN